MSWVTVLQEVAPVNDWTEDWHDDASASELHRLRGLASSQASETEAVIAQMIRLLDLDPAFLDKPAGVMFKEVKNRVPDELGRVYVAQVGFIEDAIRRRNRLVHDEVRVGSSWQNGEYVPVIDLLGGEETSETDLRKELAMQQNATRAAVELLIAVQMWPGSEQQEPQPS